MIISVVTNLLQLIVLVGGAWCFYDALKMR